jgi:hypothetical protein
MGLGDTWGSVGCMHAPKVTLLETLNPRRALYIAKNSPTTAQKVTEITKSDE